MVVFHVSTFILLLQAETGGGFLSVRPRWAEIIFAIAQKESKMRSCFLFKREHLSEALLPP